jgi:hypothetical protein
MRPLEASLIEELRAAAVFAHIIYPLKGKERSEKQGGENIASH